MPDAAGDRADGLGVAQGALHAGRGGAVGGAEVAVEAEVAGAGRAHRVDRAGDRVVGVVAGRAVPAEGVGDLGDPALCVIEVGGDVAVGVGHRGLAVAAAGGAVGVAGGRAGVVAGVGDLGDAQRPAVLVVGDQGAPSGRAEDLGEDAGRVVAVAGQRAGRVGVAGQVVAAAVVAVGPGAVAAVGHRGHAVGAAAAGGHRGGASAWVGDGGQPVGGGVVAEAELVAVAVGDRLQPCLAVERLDRPGLAVGKRPDAGGRVVLQVRAAARRRAKAAVGVLRPHRVVAGRAVVHQPRVGERHQLVVARGLRPALRQCVGGAVQAAAVVEPADRLVHPGSGDVHVGVGDHEVAGRDVDLDLGAVGELLGAVGVVGVLADAFDELHPQRGAPGVLVQRQARAGGGRGGGQLHAVIRRGAGHPVSNQVAHVEPDARLAGLVDVAGDGRADIAAGGGPGVDAVVGVPGRLAGRPGAGQRLGVDRHAAGVGLRAGHVSHQVGLVDRHVPLNHGGVEPG